MSNPWWLQTLASAASIVTAMTALWAYLSYQAGRYRKRRRLEAYLLASRRTGSDPWKPTLLDASAALGMTESEVMDAAFRSSHVHRDTSTAMFGAPAQLRLSYKE